MLKFELEYLMPCGRVAELVDAQDSKSCDSNIMRVRFSPRPPANISQNFLKQK